MAKLDAPAPAVEAEKMSKASSTRQHHELLNSVILRQPWQGRVLLLQSRHHDPADRGVERLVQVALRSCFGAFLHESPVASERPSDLIARFRTTSTRRSLDRPRHC